MTCILCNATATTEIEERPLCRACAEKVQSHLSKLEQRLARLQAAAARERAAFQTDHDRAHTMASAIPFGQPIHIGHHSEGRDRRYRAKIESTFRRAFEHFERSKQIDQRAQLVEAHDAISSDDPLAIVKLQEKIDAAKAEHEHMKAVNAERRALKQEAAYTFELRNNASNIRRMEERLTILQEKAAKASAPDAVQEEMHGTIRLVRNAEINRLQLIFPGKPSAEVIKALRSRGFVWSPSNAAWQRQLNNAAEFAADQILKSLD